MRGYFHGEHWWQILQNDGGKRDGHQQQQSFLVKTELTNITKNLVKLFPTHIQPMDIATDQQAVQSLKSTGPLLPMDIATDQQAVQSLKSTGPLLPMDIATDQQAVQSLKSTGPLLPMDIATDQQAVQSLKSTGPLLPMDIATDQQAVQSLKSTGPLLPSPNRDKIRRFSECWRTFLAHQCVIILGTKFRTNRLVDVEETVDRNIWLQVDTPAKSDCQRFETNQSTFWGWKECLF